jgi:molybdopterin-guanine dinucleotide biosynthesis protein A
LRHAVSEGFEWLVLCPCDAPFVPGNLVEVLMDAAAETGQSIVTLEYGGVVQPVFSLWRAGVLKEIETVVLEQGGGGLMFMLGRLDHAVVDWPESGVPPFFNINTPEDLAEAGRLLDAGNAPD